MLCGGNTEEFIHSPTQGVRPKHPQNFLRPSKRQSNFAWWWDELRLKLLRLNHIRCPGWHFLDTRSDCGSTPSCWTLTTGPIHSYAFLYVYVPQSCGSGQWSGLAHGAIWSDLIWHYNESSSTLTAVMLWVLVSNDKDARPSRPSAWASTLGSVYSGLRLITQLMNFWNKDDDSGTNSGIVRLCLHTQTLNACWQKHAHTHTHTHIL